MLAGTGAEHEHDSDVGDWRRAGAVASRMRGFSRDDFARFHPGGSLGRQLARVDDFMRPLADCRVAASSRVLREVLIEARLPSRRTGAIMIVDQAGQLQGIFTDSDLARLFESRRDGLLDGPVRNVMTKHPTTAPQGSMMNDAVTIMAERRISELPVVDAEGQAGRFARHYRYRGAVSGRAGGGIGGAGGKLDRGSAAEEFVDVGSDEWRRTGRS